jgi:ribosomal protein L1
MITVSKSIGHNSFKQELIKKNIETSFDVLDTSSEMLNDANIDDLERIITSELIQGLPNDTEIVYF